MRTVSSSWAWFWASGLLLLPAGTASPQGASASLPSLVNVSEARFGQGCPNPADPNGRLDSTCAVRAALSFAESLGVPGAGYPTLYFPRGVYRVAGQGFTSALTLQQAISIQGAGQGNTVLLNTSPQAATLTLEHAQQCPGRAEGCAVTIQNISFLGEGHATTGGLIEIDGSLGGTMRNVSLEETGGIALNLQGASERWWFNDMTIAHARWAVVLQGDTNEDYFQRVNVIDPGLTKDYCYGVNCPGGKLIERGTWYPDPHSAVYLDGDNVHWSDSSIKSTSAVGGMRLATVNSSVQHSYFEGYAWGGQPRANHAVAAPGSLELGHLTAAVSAEALAIPVDDAGWQPLYVNDPKMATTNGVHSYNNAYGIFPADYEYGSKEPSRAVPGITRGRMEWVQVGGFSGDGRAHLMHRGKLPVAWPAGSIMEQAPPGSYGEDVIQGNHFNSIDPYFNARYTSGCSDTEQKQEWTSSPSRLCAEIIAGVVPDGYMVPFPSQTYVHNSHNVVVAWNGIFTGGSEQDGQGWIKIPGDASLDIYQGDAPLASFVDEDTALHRYVNGNTKVQVIQWPGAKPTSALAVVTDPSAGVSFSPQRHFYTADVMHNNTLSKQYLGSQCWFNTSQGTAAPGQQVCAESAGTGGASGGARLAARDQVTGRLTRYVIRDWNVNRLAPRGETGDCASRTQSTGGVHFDSGADATLVANLSPNPDAAVTATAVVSGDGSQTTVRLCNTGSSPVEWRTPPMVSISQLP